MAKDSEVAEKTTSIKKTKTKKGWKIAKKIVLLLIIIGLMAFAGYYYKKYNDFRRNITTQEATQLERDRVLGNVAKIYNLPQGEEAVLYFIKNKDEFLTEENRKSLLFQKVETGDYLITYEKAKQVILYRPSTNKIVDSSTINVASLNVVIIGAEVARNNIENSLKSTFNDQVSIIGKNDAKSSYTDNIVVDITGKNTEDAKKIAETLNGKVGTLPDGETKPADADIVVIAGGSAGTASTTTPAQ